MSNKSTILVVKRDGRKEELDINKIHKVIQWACEGVENVSTSEIESQAGVKFFNGMKTSDLHESLVTAAHELISEEYCNYDVVAGRLAMYDIRKKAYAEFEPPALFDIVKKNVEEGWYDKNILDMFTAKEWAKLDSHTKHDRDFGIKIAGAQEWRRKYLVKNRKTGELKESPQVAYMLIAAILMKKYVEDEGLRIIFDYYDALSLGHITIPTPILAGLRTPTRQFSSCTVLECGDSLDSITATVDAAVKYASRKAGLGIGVFNLRAEKQPVKGGAVTTTGPIPFTQLLQSAVLSCSQGGVRKGSATFYHNIWHKDVEKLLVLKNNKGTEETRVRHSDHGFNINGFLLRKMLSGGDMFLFSPEDVPDMHKAFYDDQEKFAQLYEKYSKSSRVSKTVVRAEDIRDLLLTERVGTSRIYIKFTDNVNEQGSFIPALCPVRMSNLCAEITLGTTPLESFDDPNGLISLCTLSAINWGVVKTPTDFEKMCRLAVYGLDSLLDYQDYPLQAAKNSTDWYRPLGIGVNDFAHFLAKRGLRYDDKALPVVDEYMEAMAYYLTRASVDLAKKYGACQKVENTKYGLGKVPCDVRKKAVDELVLHEERFPWGELREDLLEYGIRNATLMACMPSETSSRIQNLTNGVEPIRGLVVSKDGNTIVAPEMEKLRNKYVTAWDVDTEGYIKIMAVLQKWIDQSISSNTTYDPTKFPKSQIPGTLVFRHLLVGYKYGVKTFYYNNGLKRDVQDTEEVPEDIDCEACQL